MPKPAKTPAQKTMDARVAKKGFFVLLSILIALSTLLPDGQMPSSPLVLAIQFIAVASFVYQGAHFMRLLTLRARAYDPKGR